MTESEFLHALRIFTGLGWVGVTALLLYVAMAAPFWWRR